MTTLSEKILRSREKIIEVGEFKFTIRRPTDIQMLEFHRGGRTQDLIKFVVGWEGVREMDLFPGGEGHPAPFDSEACTEWLTDKSEMFVKVVNAVLSTYKEHKEQIKAAQKN